MATLVKYAYRDASNYKEFGEFLLAGGFVISSVEELLFDSEFFIPERVGVKTLVPSKKTRDDHYLHKFDSTREVEASDCLMTAETFVELIKRAAGEGWFYEKLSAADKALARAEGRRTGFVNPDWDE